MCIEERHIKKLIASDEVIVIPAQITETLVVDAKPGRAYFVWQEVKVGFVAARTKLHLVDEATGKKGVGETSLAASK